MTTEFLFFANVVLLLRLPLLLRDRPAAPWAWLVKSAVEVVLLALLFRPALELMALGLIGVLLNALAAPGRRFRAPSRRVLLLLGVVQVLAASVVFAPGGGITFRPSILALADPVREASALGGLVLALLRPESLLIGFGFLWSANEANLLIRWLLEFLELKPGGKGRSVSAREYERGRVIGLIERAMIYGFVLAGQFAAVGFILAGKGFSRSRDLGPEDRDFSEYVIIGTLLSAGLAILLAAAVRWALAE
jgi:hypothetical protein